jgi:hypothetical protein
MAKILMLLFSITSLDLMSEDIDNFHWLAFGDIRGHLEPCGCDPQTDLGGIKRIAGFIHSRQMNRKNLLVINLGNNIEKNSPLSLQDKFILKAINRINPDASLINLNELEHLQSLNKKNNLLLSNSSSMINKYSIKKFIHTKNSILIGYLWNENVKTKVNRLNLKMLNSWKQLKGKYKSQKMILLYNAPKEDLKLITKEKIFDLIISSNMSPANTQVDGQEKKYPSSLFEKINNIKVSQVPLGGAGILTSGNLLKRFLPTNINTNAISMLPTKKPAFLAQTQPKEIANISWLTKEFDKTFYFDDFMKEYEKESTNEFTLLANARLSDLKTSPFAGAQACAGCHPQEYKIWKSSSHSHAHETLKNKNRHTNSNCISCHVVGWDKKGGFVDEKHSKHLKGVQCENCHGPRKDHIKSPQRPKMVTKNKYYTCKQCHNSTHSSQFNLNSYWKKIAHPLKKFHKIKN